MNSLFRNCLFFICLLLFSNFNLLAQIEVSEDAGCAPLQVAFIVDTADVKSYNWTFSDGQTASVARPSVLFASPGLIDVTVEIVYNDNSSESFYKNAAVLIDEEPKPEFTVDKTDLCLGDAVSFENNSKDSKTYVWYFGDGSQSNEVSPSHEYQQSGIYDVSLKALSANGCEEILVKEDLITVLPVKNVSLSASSFTFCLNTEPIEFSVDSDEIDQPLWDFGDGNTSTMANPSHKYTDPGSYEVTFSFTNANGCAQSLSLSQEIEVYEYKVPEIIWENTSICETQAIQISATSENEGEEEYKWIISDGRTIEGREAFIDFPKAGTFSLDLEVLTPNNCTYRKKDAANIEVLEASEIELIVDEYEGCAPFIFQVENNTSGISKASWVIAGQEIEGSVLEYEFNEEGSYPISSLSYFPNGCVIEKRLKQNVLVKKEMSLLRASSKVGCLPFKTTLSLDNDNVSQVIWDLGNQEVKEGPIVEVNYQESGVYYPTVTYTNQYGCHISETFSEGIYVYGGGIELGAPDTIQSCTFTEVYFNGTMGYDSWKWDFGDGNTSQERNPVHIYEEAGIYTVSLTTNNKNGCSTTIENYNIIELPDIRPEAKFKIEKGPECGVFDVFLSTELENDQRALWFFEENVVGTEEEIKLSFFSLSNLTVTLRIDESGGCNRSKAISIDNPWSDCTNEDMPPQDNPADEATGIMLQKINACNTPFELELINPADKSMSTQWTLDDGTQINENNFTHVFDELGEHTIDLYSRITADSSISVKNYYTVNIQRGVIDFDFQIKKRCEGYEVFFQPQESDMKYFRWSVNNDIVQLSDKGSMFFEDAGLYQVSLEASSTGLCNATQVKNIFIGNQEHSFDYDPVLCLGETLEVEQSLVGFDSFVWVINGKDSIRSEKLSFQFPQTGTYEVKVIAYTENNCAFEFPLASKVRVYDPKADFSASKTLACGAQEISFQTIEQEGVTYLWDFGNGKTSTANKPTVLFQPGVYTISLITFAGNCSDTLVKKDHIVVDQIVADFEYSYKESCFPVEVSFTNNSLNAQDFYWDFGDGTSSEEANPVHLYYEVPAKAVRLVVKNDNGCQQGVDKKIEGLFSADFYADQTSLCTPAKVQFTAELKKAASWFWSFGDGNTSISKNPSHIYERPGNYDIQLIVKSDLGCADTVLKRSYVLVEELKADFQVKNNDNNCVPTEISFENTSIGASGYLWDFGDGKTSTIESPTHIYNEVGDFDVKLITWNAIGCRDSVLYSSIIKTSGPETKFSVNSSIVCMPEPAIFTDISNDAVSWQWFFGDGSSSSEQNPEHVYEKAGWYNVRLLATNENGCQASYSIDSVRVLPMPKPAFTMELSGECSPVEVRLRNTSSDLLSPSFEWDLGDGRIIKESEPVVYYEKPGEYSISLSVKNEEGCMVSYQSSDKVLVRDTQKHYEANINSVEAFNYKVKVQLAPYEFNNVKHYRIYRNTGSGFRYIKDHGIDEDLFEDENVEPGKQSYEYKFQSILYCEDSIAKSELKTYNTLYLQNNNEGVGRFLQWNEHKGNLFNNYRVFIMNKAEGNWNEIAVIDPSIRSFNDGQLLCAGNYQYKVAAFNNNNPVSISNPIDVNVTVTEIQQLKANVRNTTVIGEDQILTEWSVTPVATDLISDFEIYRSIDGAAFELYQTVNADEQLFIDEKVNTDEHQYAYKVKILNKCDLNSELSNSTSSLLIKKETRAEYYELEWNEYTGWEEGVLRYLLQKKNAMGEWETVEEIPADQTSIKIVRPEKRP